jgi:hypothetical protein
MLCAYFWESSLKSKFANDPALHGASLAMHNAAVHSTLINIRAFDHFCHSDRKWKDDLLASDFPGLTVDGAFLTAPDRRRINKEIAHLTHVSVGQTKRSYRYREFLSLAIPRARQFCEYSDNCMAKSDRQLATFISDTVKVIRYVQAHYINRV